MIPESESDKIYAQYRNKVFGYVYAKVRDRTEAEDIVQSVFMKVFRNIGSFDPAKASLSTWIYTITRNTVYSYLEKKYDCTEVEWSEDIADPSESPEKLVESKEQLSVLAKALQALPMEERSVIILIYYHGQSKKATAARLGITYSRLRYLHDRAVSKLRESFPEE